MRPDREARDENQFFVPGLVFLVSILAFGIEVLGQGKTPPLRSRPCGHAKKTLLRLPICWPPR
jgi:hypothetical protein